MFKLFTENFVCINICGYWKLVKRFVFRVSGNDKYISKVVVINFSYYFSRLSLARVSYEINDSSGRENLALFISINVSLPS